MYNVIIKYRKIQFDMKRKIMKNKRNRNQYYTPFAFECIKWQADETLLLNPIPNTN